MFNHAILNKGQKGKYTTRSWQLSADRISPISCKAALLFLYFLGHFCLLLGMRQWRAEKDEGTEVCVGGDDLQQS